MRLCITEKQSVAASIAAIVGADRRCDEIGRAHV